MKFAAIQLNSSSKVQDNLDKIDKYLKQAQQQEVEYCLLPENFAQMPINEKQRLEAAEHLGSGVIQDFLQEKSKQYEMTIIAGGTPIFPQEDKHDNKVFNTCLVYNQDGEQILSYQKQHLFDVQLNHKKESYRESDYIAQGKTFDDNDDLPMFDSEIGKIGLSICYDLRFPEYYRLLSKHGLAVLVMPAAFTKYTGIAHWEVLLRARAIENQVYVIASAQTGTHDNKRETYGHSMIIDPWGEIIASSDLFENKEGLVIADLSLDKINAIRQQIPCLEHRRY